WRPTLLIAAILTLRLRLSASLSRKRYLYSNPLLQESRRFEGELMPLRMRVHDREPIGMALRRFKKLLERSGLTKELRKRKHYEKPCEARRRAKLRKQSAIRKGKLTAPPGM